MYCIVSIPYSFLIYTKPYICDLIILGNLLIDNSIILILILVVSTLVATLIVALVVTLRYIPRKITMVTDPVADLTGGSVAAQKFIFFVTDLKLIRLRAMNELSFGHLSS